MPRTMRTTSGKGPHMTLTATIDGRHDFDFAFGHWRIHNRKLADINDLGCTEWVEFDALSDFRPILGGLGNVDTFVPQGLPADRSFEGATLRMFDPATGLWRIWWMSTRAPGELDVPVEGRFVDGKGQFYCDDVIGGVPLRVRFTWFDVAPGRTRWEQAFSTDGEQTWSTNWTMTATRESEL